LQVAPGANLALPDRASLTLASRGAGGISLGGDVHTAGGSISVITSARNAGGVGTLAGDITVGQGLHLDVAGGWVNAWRDGVASPSAHNPATSGGSLALRSGAGLSLGDGALLDVSGGGKVSSSGVVSGGNAGSLVLLSAPRSDTGSLVATPFRLGNAVLRGLALQGAKGGSLSVEERIICKFERMIG
jgi:hypothetical protein